VLDEVIIFVHFLLSELEDVSLFINESLAVGYIAKGVMVSTACSSLIFIWFPNRAHS
jgi:hypothetical protein